MPGPVNDRNQGSRQEPHRGLRRAALGVGLLVVCGAVAYLTFGGNLIRRPRKTAEEAQARKALASGQTRDALDVIERWIREDPDSPEAHLMKARAMLMTDSVAEFAESLKRAEDLGAKGSEVERIRAILKVRQGKHREAWPVLNREYQSETGFDPLLTEAVAQVYLENFEFGNATKVIDTWIKAAPHDAKPYLWRTEIDSRVEDDRKRLISDYQEALKRDPSLVKARIGLANEFLKLHKNQEAAAEFDKYLAMRPDDAKAHVGAGANALEMGNDVAATKHLELAMSLDPKNAEAFRERGEIDLRFGNFARAVMLFDVALENDPYDLDAHYNRGIALGRLGREDEAKKEREITAQIRADNEHLNQIKDKLLQSPQDVGMQLEVAKWMMDHGHGSEGERWVEKLLRSHPRQPEACRLLADYYEKQGRSGLANFYRLQGDTAPSRVSTKR
ncbi:tetratricopeptide repeat protein [Singulisphaera sp. PoT]|uniref:tetratricopeptide repeat protein n=1 Tax=Singulisphaera sp. PoT TaxID=3411797 RepID=UPI003BF4DCE9